MTNDLHGGNVYAYSGVDLDYSVNLNPLGMPLEVIQAVRGAAGQFDIYPDTECRALRKAVADFEAVPEDWLVFGNGAADLIVRLCGALRPRQILVPGPTFAEYAIAAREAGATVTCWDLREEDEFQITKSFAQALRPGIDVVFLCNPNNPTGRLAQAGTIEAVLHECSRVGATLVVDECFLDFTCGQSCKSLLHEHQNLIILKAFTKMFSMAGLRLGYLLCSNASLRQRIFLRGQRWSVSTPAQVAGIAAAARRDYPERTRAFVEQERPWLMRQLEHMGCRVYSSDSNFFLFRAHAGLWDAALTRGILLRSCANFAQLDQCYYRIGLKQHEKNLKLVEVLTDLLR